MRRQRPSLGSTQNEVTKIARSVRTFIKWIAWLLVALFGYLQLKDIKIEGIVDNLNPDILRRFTLFLYYSCWVAGSSFDTNMMEDVYYIDAGRARLPANAIILLVVFGAVTALMLWMAGNNQGFSLLLDVFFFINVLGIIYIQNFLSPVAKLFPYPGETGSLNVLWVGLASE